MSSQVSTRCGWSRTTQLYFADVLRNKTSQKSENRLASAVVNDTSDKARLEAKEKQLKMLMTMMLIFMVAGPLLGPKIFTEEFNKLGSSGRQFFFIATPTVFGLIFIFYLFSYRRIQRRIKENQ